MTSCVVVAAFSRQQAGLLNEQLIWSYIIQLSAAIRVVHQIGLACRVIDPTKIIVTENARFDLAQSCTIMSL